MGEIPSRGHLEGAYAVGRLEPGYRVLFWLPVGSKVMMPARRSPNETGRATGRAVCVSLGAAPGSGWRDGAVSDRAARPGEDRSAAQ